MMPMGAPPPPPPPPPPLSGGGGGRSDKGTAMMAGALAMAVTVIEREVTAENMLVAVAGELSSVFAVERSDDASLLLVVMRVMVMRTEPLVTSTSTRLGSRPPMLLATESCISSRTIGQAYDSTAPDTRRLKLTVGL